MHTLSLKRLLPWRRCPIASWDANFNRIRAHVQYTQYVRAFPTCVHDDDDYEKVLVNEKGCPFIVYRDDGSPQHRYRDVTAYLRSFAISFAFRVINETFISWEKVTDSLARKERDSFIISFWITTLFILLAIYLRKLVSLFTLLLVNVHFLISMRSFIPRNARIIYGKTSEYSA